MIYLSILIATIESREKQLEELQKELNTQITLNNLEDEVEILIFCDNFDYPVGMKRNELLAQANGMFTVFVDDDDEVSKDYILAIITAIKSNPSIDCIGIKGKLISKSLRDKEFIHSIKYNEYSEDEKFYYRPPNHLNPIRADISKQIKFPVLNSGEDFDWAMQLVKKKLLNTEIFIDKVLYYYIFDWDKTEAQKVKRI